MIVHRNRVLRFASILLMSGTLFQFNGCFSDAASFVNNINPCGTILNCNPLSYNYWRSGYEGPGVDPDVDPACTYPPFCTLTGVTPPDPFAP
jgi:hypothetical protein